MKSVVMYGLCLVVAIDVAMQGVSLYRQGFLRSPEVVSRASAGTSVDLADQPIQGNPDTQIVLVEFSDFECPYCDRYATGVYKEVREHLVDSGKIRYAFVNTPLPIHPNAKSLAVAAMCAGKQHRFWEAHDIIFEKGTRTKDDISTVARTLDLDPNTFEQCINDPGTVAKIDHNLEQAQKLGITGTPGFAIGTTTSSGQVSIHRFVRGAQPFKVFEQAISDVALEEANGAKRKR
jgi:protein-disulfide isomerase